MLTARQRLAIFLHIGGYSNTELSAQVGVHPTTIRRWMRDPEFAREIKIETEHAMARARAQVQSAARRVADNACAAARATQTLLLSDRTDPVVLVQCARLMLGSLTNLRDVLSEPAIVPLLESDDPHLDNEPKNAPLLCETLGDEERATNMMVLRKLEERDDAPQSSQPASRPPTAGPSPLSSAVHARGEHSTEAGKAVPASATT